MRLPRYHEQTRACRSITDPGRQADIAQAHRGARALIASTLTAVVLATGTAPALAHSPQSAHTASVEAAPQRVPQSMSSSAIEKAIDAAEEQKGKPYAWGGTGPNSFDCSGLVQHSFGQAGVSLPRVAQDQVASGTRLSYADAERGDLLYWTNGGGHAYHVAIYLGGGRMIDAPGSGRNIAERAVTRYNLAGGVRI